MKVGIVAVALALVSAAVAAAGVVGRAPVGVQGRNDTKGYSPALVVELASPRSYRKGCCTDVDSGEWLGPRYRASDNPSLGGNASVDWSVHFDRTARSALAAVRAHLVHSYRLGRVVRVTVRHVEGGEDAGAIGGTAATTAAPAASSAQVEGGIAFPLCPGLYAVADFDVLKPDAGPTGTGGMFTVTGTGARAWNTAALQAAIRGVSLVGYLPVRRVSAHASGGFVTGQVTDCAGRVMPGVPVRVGGHAVRADAHGTYRAPGAAGAEVSVSAGGATASATAG